VGRRRNGVDAGRTMRAATEHTSLRVIAAFEAAKGLLVLLTAGAVFRIFHHHAQHAAEELVRHSHLNPASKYPRIFVAAAANLTDTRLWLLALGATAYSVIRLAEAYGLWQGRNWARWLGIVSAGLYLPVEVVELGRHATWTGALVLAVNVVVIVILWLARDQHRVAVAEPPVLS
jgi:uncharacterized membrane protein (DUF2068 family)